MRSKHDISEGDEIILYTGNKHTYGFQKTQAIKCQILHLPEPERNWWILQDAETETIFHTSLSSNNISGFITMEEYNSFNARKKQTECPYCKKIITHLIRHKVICCNAIIYPLGNPIS